MKHLISLLLTVIIIMTAAFSAVAVTTTEEKSRQYQVAINELETYLENNESGGARKGIQRRFKRHYELL